MRAKPYCRVWVHPFSSVVQQCSVLRGSHGLGLEVLRESNVRDECYSIAIFTPYNCDLLDFVQ
jgi:hypothetical protein